RTTMLLDNTVGDGKAEAGAAPLRLRREERIVDTGQVFGGNTDACVGDLDKRLVTAGRCRDSQPATTRHRIAGMHEEVEEHLLELGLAATNRDRRSVEVTAYLDVLRPELMLDERRYVADCRVEIDDARLAA